MAVNRDVVALAISVLAAAVAGACVFHSRAIDPATCDAPAALDGRYDAGATVATFVGRGVPAVRERHAAQAPAAAE